MWQVKIILSFGAARLGRFLRFAYLSCGIILMLAKSAVRVTPLSLHQQNDRFHGRFCIVARYLFFLKFGQHVQVRLSVVFPEGRPR